MENVKAVLFDLDNTLIERSRALKKVAVAVNRQYFKDRKAEHAQLAEAFCFSFRDGYMKNQDCFHQFTELVKWNNPPSYEDFFKYWSFYYPFYSTPVDNMEESVRYLKQRGYLVGIITNGPVTMQNAKIDSVGFRDWFDIIVVSHEYGADKPDTGIFTYTATELSVSPAQCVYVGDHPRNDIEGARNAGMQTVWYAGFIDWDDRYVRSDAEIDGLPGLRSLL